MITPFDDFIYLINNVFLGDEPSLEDFILLIGTMVAFIAFVLWCCFPVIPREPEPPNYDGKNCQAKYMQRRAMDCSS